MPSRHDDAPRQDDAPLLLYDGECAFCDRTVRFVLRHDRRRRTLAFATLQGAHGVRVRARHPALANVDSVVWADGDGVRVRTDAAIRLGRYLGGGWAVLAQLAALVRRGAGATLRPFLGGR